MVSVPIFKENILKIKERISSGCIRINRNPDEITIVAVSKGRSVDQIRQVIEGGIVDIGENRVQEALTKYNAIRNTQYAQQIKWHMVGHLQTNKVKEAVKIFDLIHSVDSISLAAKINKEASKINKIQDVLVEINASGEKTKFGLVPEGITETIRQISKYKNINIRGLMTIAPAADDSEKARPYFRKLKVLLEEVNAIHVTQQPLQILSMGMTDDFEVALEEGSSMLRLGRAIFASNQGPVL